MSSSLHKIARLFGPACLAAMLGRAEAQVPTDLPPLPDEAAAPVAPPLAPDSPAIIARPDGTSPCTPGHCSHRTALGRRRCKRHLQEAFLGFSEEFDRPPLGALMYAANIVQVRNGEAAGMIMNQFDFIPGTAAINPRGADKLAAIAARLPVTFFPVIVERSGLPALDAQRRSAVLAAIGSGPFPVPPERVVVGPPIARGLRGEDAVLVRETSLSRTAAAGPPVGVAADATSPVNSSAR